MDDDVTKKAQYEIDALLCVYDKSKYTPFGIERPDFKLIRREDLYSIGVEVTRLYFNESTARIKNIPYYSEEIIMTGKFRQGDERFLRVDSIELLEQLDENGKPRVLTGVLFTHPTPEDFLKILSEAIRRKESKYKIFTHGYKKLELIIKDEEGYFGSTDTYGISNTIFKDTLLNLAIQMSCFNEIYLQGRIVGKEAFIPLKKALFGYRAALVSHFYSNHAHKSVSYRDYPEMFLALMKFMGYFLITGFKKGDTINFLYENYLVEISPRGVRATIIENYDSTDKLTPIKVDAFLLNKYKILSDEFQQFLKTNITLLEHFVHESLNI
jgi:hypothetical protein